MMSGMRWAPRPRPASCKSQSRCDRGAHYQSPPRHFRELASAAATAVMLTMPRAVTDRHQHMDRLGQAQQHGPTSSPSVAACSRVKAILAASSVGITSRLAEPVSRLSGTARSRSARSAPHRHAFRHPPPAPARAHGSAPAPAHLARGCGIARRRSWNGTAAPPWASRPKRRTASAASRVISAICSAVGSTLTWVSQKNSAPLGRIRPTANRSG